LKPQLLQRSRFVILAGAVLALAAIPLSSAASTQSVTATVKVTAPSKAAPGGTDLQAQIDVSDVKNLGGFQFVLTVDSKVLKPISVSNGEFLGSSGREVFCPEPTVDSDSVLLKCVTLRDHPAGADGSGTLATVTLKPETAGASDLALSQVQLLEPDGTTIPTKTASGKLIVAQGGSSLKNWLIIGAVAAGAVLVVGAGGAFAIRRRGNAAAPPDA
jgi:hypothetical protein